MNVVLPFFFKTADPVLQTYFMISTNRTMFFAFAVEGNTELFSRNELGNWGGW